MKGKKQGYLLPVVCNIMLNFKSVFLVQRFYITVINVAHYFNPVRPAYFAMLLASHHHEQEGVVL